MNRRKLKNRGTACCFRKESVFLSCAKYRKHNFVSSGYCWETVSGVFIPSYGNTENSLQRHFSSTRTGRCVRSRQLSSKHKKFRREQRNASAYRYIVNLHLSDSPKEQSRPERYLSYMHRGDTYKKRISSVRQPGILFPRKQDIQLSRFPDIPCFYPAFASLLAIWLNNEPVQAIDVIVYGM